MWTVFQFPFAQPSPPAALAQMRMRLTIPARLRSCARKFLSTALSNQNWMKPLLRHKLLLKPRRKRRRAAALLAMRLLVEQVLPLADQVVAQLAVA